MSSENIRRTNRYAYSRGTGESFESYLSRVKAYMEHLENVCGVHLTWYTHKNNAGCWICDALTLAQSLATELEIVSRESCGDDSGNGPLAGIDGISMDRCD